MVVMFAISTVQLSCHPINWCNWYLKYWASNTRDQMFHSRPAGQKLKNFPGPECVNYFLQRMSINIVSCWLFNWKLPEINVSSKYQEIRISWKQIMAHFVWQFPGARSWKGQKWETQARLFNVDRFPTRMTIGQEVELISDRWTVKTVSGRQHLKLFSSHPTDDGRADCWTSLWTPLVLWKGESDDCKIIVTH